MPDTATNPSTATVQRLGGVVATLRSLMASGARRIEEAVGIPAAQIAALRAIDDGAVSNNGVAEQLLTHASSASRTVDALVRAGLVSRSPDPEDRRAVVLAVTPTGRERLVELDEHRDEVLSQALGSLSPRDCATFVDLLERFVDGLATTVRDD